MNNIQANPVGKFSKEIYIIKNDINNKVYVGQSINAEDRFHSHCKGNYDNSLIDAAIQKYGKNHFWFEILEEKTEDYNEKERYWIQQYNSISPNGYNLMSGGEDPPTYRGDQHPSTKISDEDVRKLKEDLKNTSLSLSKLGQKYGISKNQVLRINSGTSRAIVGEKYPIRENPNISGKLTEEDVDEIIELLKYTYRFKGDIGRQFGVEPAQIDKINTGRAHFRSNEQYPIRKWKSSGIILFTYEEVTDIIKALKETQESISSIARRYNVSFNAISQINQGTTKKYKRDNLQYPLRPY